MLRRSELRPATSKGGLSFSLCYGCKNYRPISWGAGGWSGPGFCSGCASRIWKRASSEWPTWAQANWANLAARGWFGYPPG